MSFLSFTPNFEFKQHVSNKPYSKSILTIVQKSKDKTAPLPEGLHEKGAGLQDANASGGQSQGIKQGPNVGQGGRSN
jgi:hypothetical protein